MCWRLPQMPSDFFFKFLFLNVNTMSHSQENRNYLYLTHCILIRILVCIFNYPLCKILIPNIEVTGTQGKKHQNTLNVWTLKLYSLKLNIQMTGHNRRGMSLTPKGARGPNDCMWRSHLDPI